MTEKTQVTQIQPGDVIDFDAHTGNYAHYEDSRHGDWSDMERVTGSHRVASVGRVEASVNSGMHFKRASEIEITFENGRSIRARGTAKFPVVA